MRFLEWCALLVLVLLIVFSRDEPRKSGDGYQPMKDTGNRNPPRGGSGESGRQIKLKAMKDLKPCPFCGGDAHMSAYGAGSWAVVCVSKGCKCYSPVLDSHAKAIERWNRRAGEEAAQNELGEIEHIAAEMAEALRRIREWKRNQETLPCVHLCLKCGWSQCIGWVADDALQKWEKWRGRRESN